MQVDAFAVDASDDDAGGAGDAIVPLTNAAVDRVPQASPAPSASDRTVVSDFDPATLDPNAKVLVCIFCGAESCITRWYVVLTVKGVAGVLLHRPDGDMCFEHGAACQCYPKLTVAECLSLYRTNANWRAEFTEVGERVVGLSERLFAMRDVMQQDYLSSECFIDIAAVPVLAFTSKWQPPAALHAPVSIIAVPPLRRREEVILMQPIAKVPADVFFWTYRVKAGSYLGMKDRILQADRIVRMDQAVGFFEMHAEQHEIVQDNKFTKAGGLGSGIIAVGQVETRFADEQRLGSRRC